MLELRSATVARGRSRRSRMRLSRWMTSVARPPAGRSWRVLDRRGRSDGPEPVAPRRASAGRQDTSLRGGASEIAGSRACAPNRLPVASAAKRVQAKGEHAARPRVRRATRPRVRRFAWAPTQGASAYHVELFRHDARIFAADTKQPQLAVPARWQMNGRQQKLSAGEYRWLVWPVVSGRRASSATVQATLTISR